MLRPEFQRGSYFKPSLRPPSVPVNELKLWPQKRIIEKKIVNVESSETDNLLLKEPKYGYLSEVARKALLVCFLYVFFVEISNFLNSTIFFF